MRIVFFGNNWVGWQVLRALQEQEDNVVGLVIHPPEKRKYGAEILRTASLDADRIYCGSRLREAAVIEAIRALKPDIGVSALFDYVFESSLLDVFPKGIVNLHPSYLPYNRGQYPNVWSIVEGTPAGVTLHYVDAGVDTGDIIAQRQVPCEPVDTGESLYRKLESACVDLFAETWPLVRAGTAPRLPQEPRSGTYHRTRDVERIDRIELDRSYSARELIDIIRARTFPPFKGAYFEVGGRRIYLQLKLVYEDPETSVT